MPLDPYLITLTKNRSKEGQLSFLEKTEALPFDIKRVYWIYNVTQDAERGNHAHLNSDRIMVCVQGNVEATIENIHGNTFSFLLNDPGQALYYPRNHWIKLKIAAGSTLI